jgi:hypothetical protein
VSFVGFDSASPKLKQPKQADPSPPSLGTLRQYAGAADLRRGAYRRGATDFVLVLLGQTPFNEGSPMKSVVPFAAILVGFSLLTGGRGVGLAIADYVSSHKCQVVPGTACQGENRSSCGVVTSSCVKCDPMAFYDCVPCDDSGCVDAFPVACGPKQVATCIPDPLNPANLICGSYSYSGTCHFTIMCN